MTSDPTVPPRQRGDRAARLALARALSALGISVAEAQAVTAATPITIAQLGETAPLPRPNPQRGDEAPGSGAAPEPPAEPAVPPVSLPEPGLLFDSAYRRFQAGDFTAAARIAHAMPDPVGGAVMDWLIATEGYPRADFAAVSAAVANLEGWPGQALMRIRFEQAFLRTDPDAETVVSTLGDRTPVLEASTLLLARSLAELGRDAEAEALVRSFWRNGTFGLATEEALVAEFGDALTIDDHRYRMDRLLYAGLNAEALRTAEFLSPDTQRLAEAWAAVNSGANNAGALLDAVPATLRSDPGYLYARLRRLVRAGSLQEAATLLASAPTSADVLIDPDAWSRQRRAIGWTLVQQGNDETAYEVLAGHGAADRAEIVEIEFQAGWVALRRLGDADAAVDHFRRIVDGSTLPLSQSRGGYWLGRALEAAGRSDDAADAYRHAAAYPTTFYGQLALDRLGETVLPVHPEPAIDAAVEAAFAANLYVTAMGWFEHLGRDAQVDLFARFLAETLTDPAEIALVARFAEGLGNHQLALQVGKLAANRGLEVDHVAFPTSAIPAGTRSDRIEMAFIYAIARQESAFNTNAVSSVGARGLLQLRPSTAEEAARALRLDYSEERLTADPAFNAVVGGSYIRTLIDRYNGSVLLAVAAYNAGISRVDDWLQAYGDPRREGVDPIDWIERIPFDETRNYVQRVIENLEVYRAILGEPTLRIAADLGLR